MVSELLRPITRYVPVLGDYLYIKISLKEWIGGMRDTPLDSHFLGYRGDELDQKLEEKAEYVWNDEITPWLKEEDLYSALGLERLKSQAIEGMKTAMKMKLEEQRHS